jgi:colanic acid/amylovoran biosynthesis glycosyltransferase
MSCGVPIVGYANDAFRGITRVSGTGRLVPINRPELMAASNAQLNSDRQVLVGAAYKSLEFARRHTFERMWQARIDHLCSFRSANTKSSTRLPALKAVNLRTPPD